MSWTSVDKRQFELEEGQDWVGGYQSSPGIVWMFCKNCGTSLFQTTDKTADTVYVVASALIDAMDRPVEGHFSFEERVPWLEIDDSLPKYVGKTSDLIREREAT